MAGRHLVQPSSLFHSSTFMTSLTLVKPFALISPTNSSRLNVVHPQMLTFCAAAASNWSPIVWARIWLTIGLQRPQERPALVQWLTWSSVVKPCVLIASTMAPFVTPLQPQISSSFGIKAISSLLPAAPHSD